MCVENWHKVWIPLKELTHGRDGGGEQKKRRSVQSEKTRKPDGCLVKELPGRSWGGEEASWTHETTWERGGNRRGSGVSILSTRDFKL